MAPSIVNSFPPELLAMVAASVEPEDHLSLKLSCKTFAQNMPRTVTSVLVERYLGAKDNPFQTQMTDTRWNHDMSAVVPSIKERLMLILARSEFYAVAIGEPPKLKRTGATQALRRLPCTSCGKFKARSKFIDRQANTSILDEPELGWQSLHGADLFTRLLRWCMGCDPQPGRMIKVGGQKKFQCVKCRKAHPMKESVFMRDGNKMCCGSCLDKEGIKYTKAKNGEGYAVYDNIIDVEQIFKDRKAGKI